MKIAVLSDTRMPTNLDYPGHGLGRSLARIAGELARRGHEVTVFAGFGSCVQGCTVVEDGNEDQRAYQLAAGLLEYDAILDGTHHFTLAHLCPEWPIVCKPVDREGQAPYRRVYNNGNCIDYLAQGPGLLINDGVDIDNIPFYPTGRGDHALYPQLLSARWKRPEEAVEAAQIAGRDIWLMGAGGPLDLPATKQIGPKSGDAFYAELGRAAALVVPMSGTVVMEAAACGTPSISFLPLDTWIEDGVTGYKVTNAQEAADKIEAATQLDPRRMREWIGDNRSIAQTAAQWEAMLERTANGERW